MKRQHRLTRARLLKSGLIALTVAAGLAASVGGRAKAATNDPVLSGNSGNAGNPNLAEDATEVQYDGGGAPGVVFLAQADGSWSPSQAAYPAAVAGWTTTNPNITTGVYGYTEHDSGNGVVGVTVSTTLNSAGVRGEASASTGQVVGVFGNAVNSPIGTGVVGVGTITGGYFRANASGGRALVADGPVSVSGNLFVAHPNSLVITSPNNGCWQVRVSDSGVLFAGAVNCP
jgi:hypothetical protein